ncbi:MAG: hypothetical protein JW785_05135 [Acidimicrobiia bacterium]|nr:hypothetical protein [Acidimicrobiia bacterium]
MLNGIPPWLARPAAVLSALAALAGSAFILWAAATGDYWWTIWAGAAFAGAALLWYLGDVGATREAGLPH